MTGLAFKDIPSFFTPHRLRYTAAWLWQQSAGLVEDFWKDGQASAHDDPLSVSQGQTLSDNDRGAARVRSWHAEPGEIAEKMWGEGYITPGDADMSAMLVKPLAIKKDMSLLDLTAGLGGRMQLISHQFGASIDGYEPDPQIAARGMAMGTGRGKRLTITPYDPMNLVAPRTYDVIMMREMIYRLGDKTKFIKSVVACCKVEAQISFTDYIVNPEMSKQPAILAWQAFEKEASPPGLVEMAELWAKSGLSLSVHEDQTDYYKKEIKAGLLRFAQYLAAGPQPDPSTKKTIAHTIMMWAHRLSAIEQGMKFYRFYGVR